MRAINPFNTNLPYPTFSVLVLQLLNPYLHSFNKKFLIFTIHMKMKKSWIVALILQSISAQAAFSVSGGVGIGVGVGIGGGGVWIGGGINNSPTPSGSSASKLNLAYIALQAWKSAITDDPLGVLNNWVGSNVCAYKGVFCSDLQDEMGYSTGPVVSGIDLNHANLKGILVKELSLLTDMSLLHLNSNKFGGTVPETFKDLYSLTELDLSNNHFFGPFPSTTLYIPNLLYLDLRFNNFSGPIPEDLFNKGLDAIFINDNQFDGQIPDTLGNSPASVINLANNKLSGSIPFSFGYTSPRLKEILFLNNQLTGCIPEGAGLWTDLQVLDVSFNSLIGHLPNSLSCLNGIEVLNLAHNKLSGVLPDLVCSLTTIVNFTVAYNFFSGLSQECNRLLRNVGLDFSLNCIPGREMQRPESQCSVIPAGSLSCLRIPSPEPLVCGVLVEKEKTSSRSSASARVSPPPRERKR